MRRMFRQKDSDEPKDKVLDVDASMQGTLSFNDPVKLRINGKFEGKLNTKGTLMIGDHANVAANIQGDYITIAGVVKGNITAQNEVRIISPAVIDGDVIAPYLSISKGAIINGSVQMKREAKVEDEVLVGSDTLTLDEVAKYLEIDKNVVYEWAENGKLPGKKQGSNWKVERMALENWVLNEKVN